MKLGYNKTPDPTPTGGGTTVTNYTPYGTSLSNTPTNNYMAPGMYLDMAGIVRNSAGQQLVIDSSFLTNYGFLHVESSNSSVISAYAIGENTIRLSASTIPGSAVISFWYGDYYSTFASAPTALKNQITINNTNAVAYTTNPIYVNPTPTPPTSTISFSNIPKGTSYMNSTGSSVNVRNASSTSGSKVDKVNKGDTRVVVGEENGWNKVMQGNGYAYIIKTYAKVYTLNEDGYRGYCTSKQSVRSSASSSASRLHYITKGGDVIIVGESGSYYKIATQGGYGYVPMSAVTLYK